MVIISHLYQKMYPLYFTRLLPVATILLCFTACSKKDDFASKPITVAPSEQVVSSSAPHEPPIIIISKAYKKPSENAAYIPASYAPKNTIKKPTAAPHHTNNRTATAVTQGNYAIQIGAFSSSSVANKAVTQARQNASSLLSTATTKIDLIHKNSSPLYRVRLTGLSANTATQACATLTQKQLTCVVVQ